MTDTSSIREPIDGLANAVREVVQPSNATADPYLDSTAAIHDAEATGVVDGAADTFDENSHNPRTPHQEAILELAQNVVDTVAERGLDIPAAINGAEPGDEPAPTKRWFDGYSGRTLLLIVLVFVAETWLGSRLWKIVTGTGDTVALIPGAGLALFFGVTASVLAYVAWASRQNLLRRSGLRVLVFVAILVGVLLAIGGFIISGVAGGSKVSIGPDGEVSIIQSDWGLLFLYFVMMSCLSVVVWVSHYHDLWTEARERVNKKLAALDALPSRAERLARGIRLTRKYLALLDDAVQVAKAVASSYVAGVRRALPPSLVSRWDASPVLEHEFTVDRWERALERQLTRLQQAYNDETDGSGTKS